MCKPVGHGVVGGVSAGGSPSSLLINASFASMGVGVDKRIGQRLAVVVALRSGRCELMAASAPVTVREWVVA